MKLWTFQSATVIQELEKTGYWQADWSWYGQRSAWKRMYQWMRQRMGEKGIPGDAPPIWAWHSCGGWQEAPRLKHARDLLSDIELQSGMWVMALDCPAEWVLLSHYGPWFDVMDEFLDGKTEVPFTETHAKRLFSCEERQLVMYEKIQACLPYVKAEWILASQPLSLLPDQPYDPEAPALSS